MKEKQQYNQQLLIDYSDKLEGKWLIDFLIYLMDKHN